jgi:putative transcriptional regulator
VIRFHPDENLLLEYSAGTLDPGLAIAVKTHISMCPKCQSTVNKLNTIGAGLLDKASAHEHEQLETDETASFSALMRHIRQTEENAIKFESKVEPPKVSSRGTQLPPIVEKLLPATSLRWKRVSPSLKQANLETGQNRYEVCLHKIRKGGKVAEHDHRGTEITIVLRGAFSDEKGTYRRGDFLMRAPGDTHRPTATQDQDCLCLSVCEAPVKLTGLLGKIVNPFLPFRPS